MRYKLYSVFACFLAVVIGVFYNAPLAYAADDDTMPSGRYINGFEIRNSVIIKDIFDSAMEQHTMFDRSTYPNCGYFAYITKGITVSDYNGNQGSRTFDDWVLVTILFPENFEFRGTIYVGARSFGVDPVNDVQPNNNYANNTQVRSILCISSINGGGDSQSVDLAFSVDCFNFDAHVRLPYNDLYRPTLYFNFPNEYGGNALFDMGGSVASYGSVDSVSDAGLLASLYKITFTPTKTMPSNVTFPLMGKELAVAPVAVVDDSGYNLISLQVPQLGYYTDVVVYGHYDFTPSDVSKYSIDKLKLSFGVDKLNMNDEEYNGDITNDEFSCTFAGWELPEISMTVNSLSFFYNTKTQTYRNTEFAAFDFSTNTLGSYPAGQFYSIGSINIKSAGSFCYNFSYEAINDLENDRPLTPDELDDLSDSGNDDTNRTISQFGYVPREFTANTLDVDFGSWQPRDYDFSAANGLLSILMNDFVIDIILACVSIGIVGLILYGKQ